MRRARLIGGTLAGTAYSAVGMVVDLTQTEPVLLCTGVLIASDAVLTSAGCLVDVTNPKSMGFALTDAMTGLPKSAFVSPRSLDLAPLYLKDAQPLGLGQGNDLGIMTFAQPFAGVTPIPIVRPSERAKALAVGGMVTIVGAGQDEVPPKTGGAGILRVASVSVMDIGSFEFSLARSKESQPCIGDAGAPVLWASAAGSGLRLLGILSRGSSAAFSLCDEGAIATRADTYMPFTSATVTLPCGSGGDDVCPDAGVAMGDGGTISPHQDIGGGGGTITPPGGGGGMTIPKEDEGCQLAADRQGG
ncbi:MAG: trypsin-like serine protease, partial [Deltaproteobacteria bacterium]|nr:trypsin-like serine protease [Deltaproteobacteria bacterium]